MDLNFSKEEAAPKTSNGAMGSKDVPWPDKDLWHTGDEVAFKVSSCDLMEVVKDEKTRIKVSFNWLVVDGPTEAKANEGKTFKKDVWDILDNKQSEKYLKYLLSEGMGCSRDLLDGGNIPAALDSVIGAHFTATCEKDGKYTNWNELSHTGSK